MEWILIGVGIVTVSFARAFVEVMLHDDHQPILVDSEPVELT